MLSWAKEKGEQGVWVPRGENRRVTGSRKEQDTGTRAANKFLLGDRGQGDAVEAR